MQASVSVELSKYMAQSYGLVIIRQIDPVSYAILKPYHISLLLMLTDTDIVLPFMCTATYRATLHVYCHI